MREYQECQGKLWKTDDFQVNFKYNKAVIDRSSPMHVTYSPICFECFSRQNCAFDKKNIEITVNVACKKLSKLSKNSFYHEYFFYF
jgi:hypothetical protein